MKSRRNSRPNLEDLKAVTRLFEPTRRHLKKIASNPNLRSLSCSRCKMSHHDVQSKLFFQGRLIPCYPDDNSHSHTTSDPLNRPHMLNDDARLAMAHISHAFGLPSPNPTSISSSAASSASTLPESSSTSSSSSVSSQSTTTSDHHQHLPSLLKATAMKLAQPPQTVIPLSSLSSSNSSSSSSSSTSSHQPITSSSSSQPVAPSASASGADKSSLPQLPQETSFIGDKIRFESVPLNFNTRLVSSMLICFLNSTVFAVYILLDADWSGAISG